MQFTLFPLVVFLHASCLGQGTQIHLLFFPAVATPFLVTHVKERALLVYGVLAPIVMDGVLLATDFSAFGPAALPVGIQTVVGFALVPTTFAILLCAVAFFAVSTARAQAHLDGRTAEMSLVLENVEQALVTVDRQGRLSPERSRALEAWFGPVQPDDTLWSYLGRVDPKQLQPLRLGFEQLLEGFLPLEVAIDQVPSRLQLGARTFQLRLSPVGAEPFSRLLVIISDVSAELAQQAAQAAQADFSRAVSHLALSRGPFMDCLTELRALHEGLSPTNTDALLRGLHTIKGNAAAWGLSQLASAAHRAEEQLLGQELEAPMAIERVRAAWALTVQPLEPWCGADGQLDAPRPETSLASSRVETPSAKSASTRCARVWCARPAAAALRVSAAQSMPRPSSRTTTSNASSSARALIDRVPAGGLPIASRS